jgi:hypothetical protein
MGEASLPRAGGGEDQVSMPGIELIDNQIAARVLRGHFRARQCAFHLKCGPAAGASSISPVTLRGAGAIDR